MVLNKEEGAGLGFSVAGGIDLEQKSIIVSDDRKSFSAKLTARQAGN